MAIASIYLKSQCNYKRRTGGKKGGFYLLTNGLFSDVRKIESGEEEFWLEKMRKLNFEFSLYADVIPKQVLAWRRSQ